MTFHVSIPAIVFGVVIIGVVLLDAFETVVLPRRVTRQFKLTAWFYRRTWIPWKKIAGHIQTSARQQSFLGYFGPLSLILLLEFWAASLILGFALLQYGIGGHEQLGTEPITFGRILYQSGETFFTLGYGDIVPTSRLARLVRLAGSSENPAIDQIVLDEVLRDWERWAGELLESHISYPVLSFFRSQHSNQSWLGALMVMLDVTSLVITGIEGIHPGQARLTFAMARHAAVDLAQVVNARYDTHEVERMTEADFQALRETLAAVGLKLRSSDEARQKLAKLRSMYEPYVHSTAVRLMVSLPPWRHPSKTRDNWQAGPWDRMIQAKGLAVLGQKHVPPQQIEDHF